MGLEDICLSTIYLYNNAVEQRAIVFFSLCLFSWYKRSSKSWYYVKEKVLQMHITNCLIKLGTGMEFSKLPSVEKHIRFVEKQSTISTSPHVVTNYLSITISNTTNELSFLYCAHTTLSNHNKLLY